MNKTLALAALLSGVMIANPAGAATSSFLCKTFMAAKGGTVRSFQEERPGLFGAVVSVVLIRYIGVNDDGTPEFREARTIFRPVTDETFWKDDGISYRNRIYGIDVSEARVLDRSRPSRPLSLRVLAVEDGGGLRYRLEPPHGCDAP